MHGNLLVRSIDPDVRSVSSADSAPAAASVTQIEVLHTRALRWVDVVRIVLVFVVVGIGPRELDPLATVLDFVGTRTSGEGISQVRRDPYLSVPRWATGPKPTASSRRLTPSSLTSL